MLLLVRFISSLRLRWLCKAALHAWLTRPRPHRSKSPPAHHRLQIFPFLEKSRPAWSSTFTQAGAPSWLSHSESAETLPFTFNRCRCDNAVSTFNSHLEVLRPTWAPQGQGIVHQGRDVEIGQRKQIVLVIGRHSVCVSIMDQKCSLEELPDLDVPSESWWPPGYRDIYAGPSIKVRFRALPTHRKKSKHPRTANSTA